MDPLYLWRSYPSPYRWVAVKTLRFHKTLKTNTFFRRAAYVLQRVSLANRVSKVVYNETASNLLHLVLGDDPTLYINYSFSMQSLTLRLLLQALARDMYITHLVNAALHWFQIDKIVTIIVPILHVIGSKH